jgi:hypothetical protein
MFFGGDSGMGDYKKALDRNRVLLDSIALPEYEQWIPETYDLESANYSLVQEDPILRAYQMQALQKMAGLANDGLSAEDQAAFAEAKNQAGQMARGNTEAAIQNAQNRGVAGSGMEFALREMANQGATERARASNMDQAAASARNRVLYNQAYMQGTSQARGDDARTNTANANILNQFNMANTQARNQAGANNANLKNDAFQYNQNLKDKNFNNQMSRATGHMNLNNQEADARMAEAEAKRRRDQGIGGLIGTGVGAYVGGAEGAAVGRGVGSALF